MARERDNSLPVVDESGEVLFHVDEDGARKLLGAGKVRVERHDGESRLLRVRRERRERPTDFAQWAFGRNFPDPEKALSMYERREVLRCCFDQLSSRHRQLLRLRYWNDLTFGEAAVALGVSAAAVSTMHDRVIEKIRGILLGFGIFNIEQI